MKTARASMTDAARISLALGVASLHMVHSSQCIIPSTKFLPVMSNLSSTKQMNAEACQVSCGLTTGCYHFSFLRDTLECTYAGPDAQGQADYRATSGPAFCRSVSVEKPQTCVNEVAENGFPGLTAADSNSVWASGTQPAKLECWPKDKVTSQPLPCDDITVIEDSDFGWPGKCLGLYHQTNLDVTCEAHCKSVPTCQGWQLAPDQSCWEGLGESCYVRPNWAPIRSQRYQHGNVRVLMDLTGWQVMGLHRVFDVKGDGYFNNDADAVAHCKLACYSDIKCDYWSYSTWYGCWVEDVNVATVEYPLTLNSMTRDSDFAKSSIAGEYIQHTCAVGAIGSAEGQRTSPSAPFCELTGYRLDPLDMPGSTMITKPNSLECQFLCASTSGCAYFTFLAEDNACHLQGSDATLVQVQDGSTASAGPAVCPGTTPAPHAECGLHPSCSNYSGLCCPNLDGYTMDCCSIDVINDAPTSPPLILGTSFHHEQQRSADFIKVGASAPTENQDTHLWWLLLLALALVVCGCCIIAKVARSSKSRSVKLENAASPAYSTKIDTQSFVRDMEAPEQDYLMSDVTNGSNVHLPFPEAGLPSNNFLPFPEVGLPHQHGQPQFHG